TTAAAAEPPDIPVGVDAYRQWARWPYQRIGARAYMRSTYDRQGGNEGADASHFLYQQADDFNVTLDVEGPGVLYFARYNRWHGSPWHYEVDGTDHLVGESSTADPNRPVKGSVFLPRRLFRRPLASTADRRAEGRGPCRVSRRRRDRARAGLGTRAELHVVGKATDLVQGGGYLTSRDMRGAFTFG